MERYHQDLLVCLLCAALNTTPRKHSGEKRVYSWKKSSWKKRPEHTGGTRSKEITQDQLGVRETAFAMSLQLTVHREGNDSFGAGSGE